MTDPTTQSNYLEISTQHVALDWQVDFTLKVISGSATHDLIIGKDGVEEVIFDTSDLDISAIEVNGTSVTYNVKPKHPVMGSALHIPIPSLKSGSSVSTKITYKTTAECTALQWLDKDQTQGGQFPYLFSQCQPIHARSIAPLQDTSSSKIKFTASITSTLPVLLSAIRISPPSDGPAHGGKTIGKDLVTYRYTQPIPIATYILAIAAGNVRYRPFPKFEDKQWSSGVWAEPQIIDQAYWEFSEDTTRFLAAAEKLVIPYHFGVYDLLVLPPSFPYGGMENACLTFVTPTLLTRDRALVNVVVHELTHSWFGNGVTQANASHFWLNEGWTTYIERVLLQVLHSPEERGLSFVIGSKALNDSLKEYETKPKYQRLSISFEIGEDPDDAYSRIPYDKGANFLLHLERILGGLEIFLPYVKDYAETFIGKSITTEQWKEHLYAYFSKYGGPEKIKALDGVDWDAWLYGEGLELPVKMEYDLTLAQKAYQLAEKWDSARGTEKSKLEFTESDLKEFSPSQTMVFLERLQTLSPLPSYLIIHLGDVYKFKNTFNAEFRFRFYEVAFSDPSSPAAKTLVTDAAKWLIGDDETGVVKGRMKFCRKVFRAVWRVDKDLVLRSWEKAKNNFHPIARKLIEKDLEITK